MNDNILAHRLKKLRDKSGLLQKQVADKLGVKSNTLSGYENGTRSPDAKLLNDLANIYKVTVDYLIGRSDDPRLSMEEDKEVDEKTRDLLELLDSLPKEKRDRYMEEIKAYVKIATHADDRGED